MSWYKEWFDSQLYEWVYADRDEWEAQRLVDWLKDIIPRDQYPKVLDLGCGRGRHAFNLAEHGYKVLGIDLSESAIRKAKKIKKERNLNNVRFEVGDMRDQIPEKFDGVVNLFTSFGYFKTDQENEKILGNVSSMLREEGVFVLDYFNSLHIRQEYTSHETGEVEDLEYEIERYIKDGAIFKEITFNGESVNGSPVYTERVKLYDLSWFKERFSAHELDIKEIFGDYDGSSFDADSSPRLILVATRQ